MRGTLKVSRFLVKRRNHLPRENAPTQWGLHQTKISRESSQAGRSTFSACSACDGSTSSPSRAESRDEPRRHFDKLKAPSPVEGEPQGRVISRAGQAWVPACRQAGPPACARRHRIFETGPSTVRQAHRPEPSRGTRSGRVGLKNGRRPLSRIGSRYATV